MKYKETPRPFEQRVAYLKQAASSDVLDQRILQVRGRYKEILEAERARKRKDFDLPHSDKLIEALSPDRLEELRIEKALFNAKKRFQDKKVFWSAYNYIGVKEDYAEAEQDTVIQIAQAGVIMWQTLAEGDPLKLNTMLSALDFGEREHHRRRVGLTAARYYQIKDYVDDEGQNYGGQWPLID